VTDLAAFDYELPVSSIAQVPAEPREAARLLVAVDRDGAVEHRRVGDVADLLGPGDLLVVNDTRVLPARLRLAKETGGAVEVLLLEGEGAEWEALVRPGGRVRPGTVLVAGGRPAAEVGDRLPGGRRAVRLLADPAELGEVPLPPYITTPLADPERYQTVYGRRPVSAAAPTAGLHLTHALFDRCRSRGIDVAAVELAIGTDTFRPITAGRVEDHVMHSERYRVPDATAEAVERAARVVAVGTTTVRALESMALTGEAGGRTSLFIHGDFRFRAVDVLLTNFHLPRSSLLVLLDAFCGPRWRILYDVARTEGYRFLSFGDAMLVSRR